MVVGKALPAAFGRYQVVGELGAGAMGQVFLGVDGRLGRPVAIKVLRIPLEYATAPAEFEQRFRREAEAAGRLNHPNVVQVYDIGPDFLVMEYVEGETLHAAMKRGRPMTLGQIGEIVQAAADALDYAHRNGVIHRDVKPANVMLGADGVVKVMDFGVARLDDSKLTMAGTVVGSIQYMAPEQMTGDSVDGRADVFSLATVAYEMLTGVAAFPGKSISGVIALVVMEQYAVPSRLDSRLPESINPVFQRALARQPERRYARATEFASDLHRALRPVADLAAGGHLEADTAPDAPTSHAGPASPPPGATIALNLAEAMAVAAEGALLIETDPPGARVVVDDVDRGRTPAEARELRLGVHTIHFECDGYRPVTVSAELTKDRPVRMITVSLSPRIDLRPVFPGKLVPFGKGVTPPVRVSGAAPAYPEAARRRGVGGTCVVEFWVNEFGEPKDVTVVSSAGSLLDKPVVAAVSGWRFTPAQQDGVPVSLRLTEQHTFGTND